MFMAYSSSSPPNISRKFDSSQKDANVPLFPSRVVWIAFDGEKTTHKKVKVIWTERARSAHSSPTKRSLVARCGARADCRELESAETLGDARERRRRRRGRLPWHGCQVARADAADLNGARAFTPPPRLMSAQRKALCCRRVVAQT